MKRQTAEAAVQGLVAGLIGYLTVALLFAALNVIAGRSPFYTAAAMGSSLFYGATGPADVLIEPGPIIAYNGIHMLSLLIIGWISAFLLTQIEEHHGLWYFVFFVFLAGFLYSLVLVGIVGSEIMGAVSWWAVVVSNFLWATTMGWYLLMMHSRLLGELQRESREAV